MIYLDLFLGFFQVGCFAFGGAYGAIPLIRDMVLAYGWLNDETLAYMIAVSESTPGPIMVNLATYIGSIQAGFTGAAVATFAVVLPAFILILCVVAMIKNIFKNIYVQIILDGLKPCIVGIVFATGIFMIINNFTCLENGNINKPSAIITVILAILIFIIQKITKKKFSPTGLIILSSFLGIVVYSFF